MNIIMVWAWMLLEHERSYDLGMDALVIARSRARTLLWCVHGCSGHRTQSNMNVFMDWAWMFWSAHAAVASTTRKLCICECELSANCSAKAAPLGSYQEPSNMNISRTSPFKELRLQLILPVEEFLHDATLGDMPPSRVGLPPGLLRATVAFSVAYFASVKGTLGSRKGLD